MTPYGHFPGRERYQLSATAPTFYRGIFQEIHRKSKDLTIKMTAEPLFCLPRHKSDARRVFEVSTVIFLDVI